MMKRTTLKISSFKKLLLLIMVSVLVLSACATETEPVSEVTPGSDVQKTEVSVDELPTATPTEQLPSVLNVCIANEPASLYRYDGRNTLSKQSIFAALYGLSDNSSLLSVIPSPETPDLFMQEPVLLEEGMTVLSSDNEARVLISPLSVFTIEGKNTPVEWQANEARQMLRSTIIYKLNEGQLWSDGQPLNAHDVLYSYHLARRLNLPGEQWALDRTASFEALDEHTLRWTGIPGFTATDAKPFFWKPLPAHILETLDDDDLLTHPMAAQTPPGWGPWRIIDWQKGKQLSFEKNPNFNNGLEEKVSFDFLNFLIVPELEQALQLLERGECQILDKSYQLESLDDTRLNELAGQYQLVIEDFDLVEQLVFGINSADENAFGDDSTGTGRANILGDQTVRQAIVACLSQPSLPSTLLDKDWLRSGVPSGMDIQMLMPPSLIAEPHAALTQAGWVAQDNLGSKRVASGVANVADGTLLELSLLSGQSAQSQAIATEIARLLGNCGIAVTHQNMPAEELYAPGPEGPLFGRHFDLAIVNWGNLPFAECGLYTSGQMPAGEYWIGTNIAGYQNTDFDYGCMMGKSDEVMAEHAPAVFLMPQLRLWLASPSLALPEGIRFENLGAIKTTIP